MQPSAGQESATDYEDDWDNEVGATMILIFFYYVINLTFFG